MVEPSPFYRNGAHSSQPTRILPFKRPSLEPLRCQQALAAAQHLASTTAYEAEKATLEAQIADSSWANETQQRLLADSELTQGRLLAEVACHQRTLAAVAAGFERDKTALEQQLSEALDATSSDAAEEECERHKAALQSQLHDALRKSKS